MSYNKGVLFDLDGTILETESIYMQLMMQYNKIYGKSISKHFYMNNFVGKTRNEISNILNHEWGEEYIDNIYWTGLLKYRTEYLHKNKINIKYGFYDLIDYLKTNNWGVAIVTSNSQSQVKELLDNAKIHKNLFNIIITRDEVEKVKPSSDLYLLAKQKLNIDFDFIFAIEDSNIGLQAAQNLNIKTIYIKDICKVNKSLQKRCYGSVKSFKDVLKILKKWSYHENN